MTAQLTLSLLVLRPPIPNSQKSKEKCVNNCIHKLGNTTCKKQNKINSDCRNCCHRKETMVSRPHENKLGWGAMHRSPASDYLLLLLFFRGDQEPPSPHISQHTETPGPRAQHHH